MKKRTRFFHFSLWLLSALSAAAPVASQTHTPKYIAMTNRTNAYYEYLPQGYDPNGSATYPLLLFITGIGEFGTGSTTQLPKVLKNGPPKHIENGTFPTSFTVGGQTHKFIVITPQFITSPRPTAADIEPVLNYIVANYKVNTSRIYITGLSYGGGVAWAYPGDNAGFAQRVAATVPVAGAAPAGGDPVIYSRSRVMAKNNVAVWAFHNSGDPSTPVATTNYYISSINEAPAPTPLAKKTIFSASGHDAWTKAYDPTYEEGGLNIYEWMLQYQRSTTTAKIIQVNVFGGTNPYNNTAWNNWNVGAGAGTNINSAAFKYSTNTASAISATLSATNAVGDNGSGYGSGMAPAEVLRYASNHTATRTLTIKGLTLSKLYSLEFYASRSSSTSNNNTVFTVNGVAKSVPVNNNLTVEAVFDSIAPNSSGQIVVSISKTASYNYLNGFSITEFTSNSKYVKVNIYGGTNPYNNAEWNNWNVGTGAGTNKTFNALKYSNGATSTINALLSATSGVGDNGSSYSGGMAPAEVLRYTSSHNALRTLTLSGLSTSKTYNVELYASRSSGTSNNNTVFTVNGTSVSINVNNNLTNKAVFSNLTPNGSGQIVISINKTATYSYLNGFMLTETNGGLSVIRRSPVATTEPVTTHNLPKAGAFGSLRVAPNPALNSVVLSLNNNYSGAVQVQVSDAAGKVYKEIRFVKPVGLLQQPVTLQGLPKGLYFITAQMGTHRQTIPVSKL